ncbi:SDR family NAD(P)-dependent oxidoreductase [Bradyrhizobium sp. CCBAU 11361]|uniref:SDR family NAD(P)-dependent oxidoreductase n=1 Tax=Bradyrhizobium sp. CCBAU 11361 TaxID=1630812 RepID=UPI002304C8FF|nr:SDR family NAD(P)-dependent oxidoreductase [Bradyrhizobium sp. CCBAU 11361]MDA9489914.1 3-oxoacyl-ACP reductase [Bradyrhizobium sp. CCBAU 11361]
MGPLKEKTAIVTGAARGIGLGIADRLSQEGCQVAYWDRNAAESSAGSLPADALSVQVDVTDPAAIDKALGFTLQAFGKIDILINNAGINGPVAPVWDYPIDAWNRVIDVDLNGVFYCCRAVVPHMRAQGSGRIVNVASITGKEGMPGIAAYAAAKAGVIGFTKSIARELCESGILVNAVTPAITETDLFKEMTSQHIEAARQRIPMGRFLKIGEIAAMVAWIAGPECSFTTGFAFDLSGGRATY